MNKIYILKAMLCRGNYAGTSSEYYWKTKEGAINHMKELYGRHIEGAFVIENDSLISYHPEGDDKYYSYISIMEVDLLG